MSDRARSVFRRLCLGLFVASFAAQSFAAEVERWGLNMTEGVTSVSRNIHSLHMNILWWCVAIGVVVFGVMFYSMLVHRKSKGAKAANFHESTLLEVVWTIIPFIILGIMAVPATATLIEIYDSEEADIEVLITGYQWKWKYDYIGQELSFFSLLSTPKDEIYNRSEKNPNYLLEVDEPLVIPVDKKVRFLVTANDVIHSWWVPDLAVKKDAIPGYVNAAWTKVDKPGIYRGQCAELCGKDHGFMPIVVKAVEQQEYDAWLAERRAASAKLKALSEQTFSFDELYAQGQQVYEQLCAACHQANGEGVPPMFPAIKDSPVATGAMDKHLDMVINGSPSNPTMAAFGPQLSELDIAAVVTYQRNAFGNNMGDQLQPIDVLKAKQ
ncbi:MAG: cytochrome c oxidase subunit II [Cellvibrionaceae bacterium]|nr:cytochrome c oxidase subunit II [Cellvibrionaceae bacterium]MCV6624489.1 cytochrome c oxidase subunit II [Cellvibrionaceae bacterium]